MSQPFTPDEVALIRRLAPEMTRVDEAGNVVVLKTRDEIRHLQLRYPSMDPTTASPPVKTGNAEEDALRARYPSMYRDRP